MTRHQQREEEGQVGVVGWQSKAVLNLARARQRLKVGWTNYPSQKRMHKDLTGILGLEKLESAKNVPNTRIPA